MPGILGEENSPLNNFNRSLKTGVQDLRNTGNAAIESTGRAVGDAVVNTIKYPFVNPVVPPASAGDLPATAIPASPVTPQPRPAVVPTYPERGNTPIAPAPSTNFIPQPSAIPSPAQAGEWSPEQIAARAQALDKERTGEVQNQQNYEVFMQPIRDKQDAIRLQETLDAQSDNRFREASQNAVDGMTKGLAFWEKNAINAPNRVAMQTAAIRAGEAALGGQTPRTALDPFAAGESRQKNLTSQAQARNFDATAAATQEAEIRAKLLQEAEIKKANLHASVQQNLYNQAIKNKDNDLLLMLAGISGKSAIPQREWKPYTEETLGPDGITAIKQNRFYRDGGDKPEIFDPNAAKSSSVDPQHLKELQQALQTAPQKRDVIMARFKQTYPGFDETTLGGM